MALGKKTVRLDPSSTGKGGVVYVSDPDSPASDIIGAAYWAKPAAADPPTQANTDQRTMVDAVVNFIETQSPSPNVATGGVLMFVNMASGAVGNNFRRRLYLNNGVITPVVP